MPPGHITILGAGLTGLAAAYRLSSSSRLPPSTRITLLESSRHIGGWVDSTRHAVGFVGPDGGAVEGDVVLEGGPRSIRPRGSRGAPYMLRLIRDVGLEDAIVPIPSDHPAATNRYILDPLSCPSPLPIRLSPFASKPALLSGAMRAILAEPFRRRNSPPAQVQDESVHAFLLRRFNPATARLASAVMHGIYAASTTELSAQSVLHGLYDGEREYGSVVRGAWRRRTAHAVRAAKRRDQDEWDRLGGLGESRAGWSMYGLTGGLGALTSRLEDELRRRGVEIRAGEAVTAVRTRPRTETQTQPQTHAHPEQDIQITTTAGTFSTSHLVSTLPPRTLCPLLPSPPAPDHLPHLLANTHTSLGVISLVYPAPPAHVHPNGFGYLLPRTPPSHNPHGVLGCVFDSTALPGLDGAGLRGKITKLTVMLGGPYWSTYATDGGGVSVSELMSMSESMSSQNDEPVSVSMPVSVSRPTDAEHAVRIAREHVEGVFPHLKGTEPILAVPRIHDDAIPTYRPGHGQRLGAIHRAIQAGPWRGRLSLVGNGYGGIGVNDCVYSAEDAAQGILDGAPVTGLERWADA